ncbi:hypothetical protein GGI06_006365, partial [Coemansia sp. S85]
SSGYRRLLGGCRAAVDGAQVFAQAHRDATDRVPDKERAQLGDILGSPVLNSRRHLSDDSARRHVCPRPAVIPRSSHPVHSVVPQCANEPVVDSRSLWSICGRYDDGVVPRRGKGGDGGAGRRRSLYASDLGHGVQSVAVGQCAAD